MTRTLCLASVFLAAAVAGPARGQDALGRGDLLDANSGVGTGGYNLRGGFPNFRDRNLLITRDVAGGRGFRGTVGYTAAFDFRHEEDEGLGSNDLFEFRAASAFSNPAYMSAGKTFEQLRFGQYRGVVEYRREGRGASLQSVGELAVYPSALADDRLRLDEIALSSTTPMMFESAKDAQIVGVLRDPEGRQVVASASSLRGLMTTPVHQQAQLIGLNSYDLARTREDLSVGRVVSPMGLPFEADFRNLIPAQTQAATPQPSGQLAGNRIEAGLEPDYRRILEDVAQRSTAALEVPEGLDTASMLTRLSEEFEELRAQLAGTEPAEAHPRGAMAGQPEGMDEPPTLEELEAPLRPRHPFELDIDMEQFGHILRHGKELDRLASEDQTRFNELMASGEKLLRAGEYFRAERRFVRALRFTPGHPLATAGMVHSQLGAGLYVPASLLLRRLMSVWPEMIDVRYAQELLPSRVRLNIAIRTLRRLIVGQERDRALHAFLLAYIGHQLRNRDLVEEGLGAMAPDDPFRTLLKEVWLPKAGDEVTE